MPDRQTLAIERAIGRAWTATYAALNEADLVPKWDGVHADLCQILLELSRIQEDLARNRASPGRLTALHVTTQV